MVPDRKSKRRFGKKNISSSESQTERGDTAGNNIMMVLSESHTD